MRSLISLRVGVYDASTDYSGRFTPDGRLYDASWSVRRPGRLYRRGELRDTKATWAAYEYYSFAPQMKYVDADVTPVISFAGGVNKTHISDDDSFEVRTTLRLNVAFGALPPPTYNQPLK